MLRSHDRSSIHGILNWRRWPGIMCLLLLSAGHAGAQSASGGIRGIVKDETGAVLAGVTVEASSPARIGGAAVDVTNDQGLYRFEGLPVGVYTVTFTLTSFATLNREDIRAEIGRTIQLDVAMKVGALEQSITVTGQSPVVDSVNAGYTTNFNQQLIANIPSARTSYFDLVTYAPAVKTDQVTNVAVFNVYGSNADQNSFQYDGVDVASPSFGSPWDFPNFDIIQEVEVKSVGASAEYYGFQGGVINIITKSGSNTWRGVGTLFFSNDAMVANNTPDEEFPFSIDYQQDYNFQLGGPLIKDRLWVNGIIQAFRNRTSQVGVDPSLAPKRHTLRPFFKVTAKLSTRDTLNVSINDNNFWSPNQASRTRPPQTILVEHGHNPVVVARWTRTLTDHTVLEVKGGGIYIRDRLDPNSGNFETPGRYDYLDGTYKANGGFTWREYENKTTVDASISHNADNFIKGSHDFKFGMQIGPSLVTTNGSYLQNRFYYDYGGPYYVLAREPYATGGRTNLIGGFAQDTWQLNDRLTLNLGVRADRTTASIPEIEQYDSTSKNPAGTTFGSVPDLITFAEISPRLGVTIRLDESGKTIAKASYGRYYGKLNTNMFSSVGPGNTPFNAFFFNPDTGQYDIPFYSIDPKRNFGIDPTLDNQYTDQVFVGLEREILPDFGVDASFVYKKEHNFIRLKDVQGVYVTQPFEDTFRGTTQILTVYDNPSGSEDSLFQVTNRNDLKQSYKAFVLQGYKRFSDDWQLHASYLWQRALGYAGGDLGVGSQDFNFLGPRSFGRDPNDLINAYGRLATDSTHAIKLSGTYVLPYQFHLGARYSYESGRPYGRVINVGLSQGVRDILAEPRGNYSLAAVNDFQIRVDKDFDLGGQRRLRLSVDVYNLFNSDTSLTVRNNSSESGDELFGQSLSVFGPRRAQVGIRFEF